MSDFDLELVYAGKRFSNNLKPFYVFYNPADDDTIHFKKLTKGIWIVGHLYKVKEKGDSTFSFPLPCVGNKWEGIPEEKLIYWEAMDASAKRLEQATKVKSGERLKEVVEILKTARQGMSPSYRKAFDLWLIQEIST